MELPAAAASAYQDRGAAVTDDDAFLADDDAASKSCNGFPAEQSDCGCSALSEEKSSAVLAGLLLYRTVPIVIDEELSSDQWTYLSRGLASNQRDFLSSV